MDNINVTPGFVLAGEATFTVSNGDGKHFTYHVYKAEPTAQFPQPSWFIKVLTGPDNSTDYSYLGKLDIHPDRSPTVRPTARSKFQPNTLPFKVAQFALKAVWHVAAGKYTLPAHMSIKHIGKCGRCGRALTNPASLDTGLGPECADAAGVPWGERRAHIPDASYPYNDPIMALPLLPEEAAMNTGHPGHPSNHGDK